MIQHNSALCGFLVNVGCGKRFHSAWKNFDLHSNSPAVTACDLTRGIPLVDETASVVYTAAVLEHIRRRDVPGFLAECHRVLKSNGWIRVAVPDFRKQVQAYLEALRRLETGDDSAEFDVEWMILEMVDQVGRDKCGGGMAAFLSKKEPFNDNFVIDRIGEEGRELRKALKGKELSCDLDFQKSRIHNIRCGRIGRMVVQWLLRSRNIERDLLALEVGRFRLNSGEVHQWVYDRHSLTKMLAAAGFTDLRVLQHGESRIAGWADYYLEVDRNGLVEKPDLLIVEGRKA